MTEAQASADPTSLKEFIKGDWQCSKIGDDAFYFAADDSTRTEGASFGVFDSAVYELSIDATSWKLADYPVEMGHHDETRSSGNYTIDNGNLVFKIEKYEYADGTIEKSSHALSREAIGKTFTISGLPEKVTERANPVIKGKADDGPLRYLPTPTGFSLQRSADASLECRKS